MIFSFHHPGTVHDNVLKVTPSPYQEIGKNKRIFYAYKIDKNRYFLTDFTRNNKNKS